MVRLPFSLPESPQFDLCGKSHPASTPPLGKNNLCTTRFFLYYQPLTQLFKDQGLHLVSQARYSSCAWLPVRSFGLEYPWVNDSTLFLAINWKFASFEISNTLHIGSLQS